MRVLRATDSLFVEVWFSSDTEDHHPRICLRSLSNPQDLVIAFRPDEIDPLIAALSEAAALIEEDQQDTRALFVRKG